MNDMTLDFFKELVRADGLNRAHVGLDYFDASINRIGAYIIGTRATQKCILSALLEPLAKLRELEAAGKGFQKLALLEEAKTPCWKKPRRCPSAPCSTISTTRMACPWARNSSRPLSSTRKTLLRSANRFFFRDFPAENLVS